MNGKLLNYLMIVENCEQTRWDAKEFTFWRGRVAKDEWTFWL